MILDVGCGSRNMGNVNLDLNLGRSDHHKTEYDVKSIENFVNASAASLPFKNNVFTQVYSSHTLEHLLSPIDALNEWKRVSKYVVVVIVPNNPVYSEHKKHLYSWSETSLRNIMTLVFDDAVVFSRSRDFQLRTNPLMKRILNLAVLKRPLNRLVSKLMGIELVNIGYKNKEIKK